MLFLKNSFLSRYISSVLYVRCYLPRHLSPSCFFFFNDTATTEIYTLSLHDALPISGDLGLAVRRPHHVDAGVGQDALDAGRLASAHRLVPDAHEVVAERRAGLSDDLVCEIGRAHV